MGAADRIAVLALDADARRRLQGLVPRALVASSAEATCVAEAQHVFVFARASQLEAAVARIGAIRDRVRVLFVEADVRPEWIPEALYRSGLRSLRKVVVHAEGDGVAPRILRAWRAGAQDRLIADAAAVADALEVRSCSMDRFKVPFDALRVLASLDSDDRADFEIDADGTRISWPEYDVDLGLDALAGAVDPAARARMARQALLHEARIGTAIAQVRERHGLTQAQVPGLSERQVRRIEKGECRPRVSTLTLLAGAHGASLVDYLGEIAGVATGHDDEPASQRER